MKHLLSAVIEVSIVVTNRDFTEIWSICYMQLSKFLLLLLIEISQRS